MKLFSKSKQDNSGFSLVEVLIAMVMLAIVAAPFLNAFVASSRTNARAKEAMNATTIAQNLLESLETNTIEELQSQFGNPDAGFSLLGGSTFENAGVISAGTNAANGIYAYYLDDVNMGSGLFDVRIDLDAGDYRASGTSSVKPNSKELPNIADFNAKHDAFYIQKSTDDLGAAKLLSPEADSAAVIADMEREITIDIDESVTVPPVTTVSATYTYTYIEDAIEKTNTATHSIFSNSGTKAELDRVILFYMPLYTSTSGDMRDSIVVNNPDNLPVDLYIVKQETLQGAALQTAENLYKMSFSLNETYSPGATEAFAGIRTNLGENLYSLYDSTVTLLSSQAGYHYNGVYLSAAEAEAKLNVRSLAAEEVKDRVFDVEVSIYRKNAYEESFPTAMKIKSIGSSQLD